MRYPIREYQPDQSSISYFSHYSVAWRIETRKKMRFAIDRSHNIVGVAYDENIGMLCPMLCKIFSTLSGETINFL